MGLKLANQAATTLASGITAIATSATVASTTGAVLPALGTNDYFYATLANASGYEIVLVTARAGDVLTIVRAQEGTTAKVFSAGDPIELRPTAQTLQEFVANPSQNPQDVNYTLQYTAANNDSGKTIIHASATAHTYTIPANGSVPFPVGTTIQIRNKNGAGVITLAITTDTLRMSGSGTGGAGVSRSIAAHGFVTLYKESATEWVVGGTGLS